MSGCLEGAFFFLFLWKNFMKVHRKGFHSQVPNYYYCWVFALCFSLVFQLCLQTFVGNALPVFRHKIIIYRGVIEKWKVIDLAESYACMRYTDTVLVSKEELWGVFVFHLLKSEQCWMYYIRLEHLLTY